MPQDCASGGFHIEYGMRFRTASLRAVFSIFFSLALGSGMLLYADGTLQAQGPSASISWQTVGPGLAYALIPLPEKNATLACVRMDPEKIRFSLHLSSESGAQPVSLGDRMERSSLSAAINASMYLPDHRTSIGYLRNGAHENNPRVAAKLGAFFVAEPREPGLPRAALLDKETDDYQALLPKYSIVIQNFRLFSPKKNILWPKVGSNAHSIATVAQDENGFILFLHCGNPLTIYEFTEALLSLPLRLKAAMYVEGGSDAQLSLREGSKLRTWTGRNSILPSTDTSQMPLPNILGAQLR